MTELMKEFPSPNVTRIVDTREHLQKLFNITPSGVRVQCHDKGIFVIDQDVVLNPGGRRHDEAAKEIQMMMENLFAVYGSMNAVYPVSFSGLKDVEPDKVGSERFCNMDPYLATWLTNLIKGRSLVDVINFNDSYYEMLNVSQYFRFMRYRTGGEHVPHYDSDYVYPYNKAVTKYSLVMYFTDNSTGQLAFVNDSEENEFERADWARQATNEEIYLKLYPSSLRIVLFPHTLCHSVLPFTPPPKYSYRESTSRIIARGDILFKRIES